MRRRILAALTAAMLAAPIAVATPAAAAPLRDCATTTRTIHIGATLYRLVLTDCAGRLCVRVLRHEPGGWRLVFTSCPTAPKRPTPARMG